MIFFTPIFNMFTLLQIRLAELEQKLKEQTEDRFPYTSFDGTVKVVTLGTPFFRAIDIEKQIIKSLPLHKQIVDECKKIEDKKNVLDKMNGWVLPDTIFKLMPEWWRNNGNGIQEVSASVTAIHRIIQEELK